MAYVKCPRCNLNYINESESYCRICLEELGKIEARKEYDLDDMELCPECEENLIKANETMCKSCMAFYEKTKSAQTQDDFVDDIDDAVEADDDELLISMEELGYQEDAENEEEEESI
jgi:hypothetical protein